MQYVFTLPEHRHAAVVAISSFDGVHSGHQRMLAETTARAERLDATPIALLPWPATLDGAVSNSVPDGLLTTLGERLALITHYAPATEVVVLPADAPRPWSPETLIQRIMYGWDLSGVVLDDIEAGDLFGTELAAAARLSGLPVVVLPSASLEQPELPESARAGSLGACIRDNIVRGRVAEAARLLGYEYTLSAEVVGGDRRGRLLGFPTANLRVDAGKLIPANGIYAVRVGLPGDPDVARPAVASVGVRPTFGEGRARLVEVYLLDLSMDLYGVRIATTFVEWLRAEERFDDVEALVHQMGDDVAQARQVLAHRPPISQTSPGAGSSPSSFHPGDAHP